jgi:cytidylate kinase
MSREEVEELEERIPSFIERVAQTNALAFPDLMLGPAEMVAEPEQAKLARVTRSLMEELGRQDRLVLVGRAAAAVLGRRSDALHVKLVAGREWRIQRAVERLGLSAAKAAQIVDDRDRNRLRYHREFFNRDWADPVNYHLTLNTERLGFDLASSAVVAVARGMGW